jgi:HEPN domain-containing protein
MKPLTHEWIAKAEGDFATLLREMRARTAPNYDAACFHAQQCAEKYLKARLQEHCVPFPKTHDLEALIHLLLPSDPAWDRLRIAAQVLSSLAIEVRYPGYSATKKKAQEALRHCRAVRNYARASLGLAP